MKRITGSLAIGFVGVFFFILVAKVASPGPHWYDTLVWLSLELGTVLNGSIHGGGSDVVFFLTLLLEFSGLAYLALFGLERLRRRRENRARTHSR